MSKPGLPAHVLLSRLAFQLETVGLHLRDNDTDKAAKALDAAMPLVQQLQKGLD